MTARHVPIEVDALAHDRRVSQMRYLCHFLEVFASGEPVMRAAAVHYGERLRDEGCHSDSVIRMAATALLVALEREMEEAASVCDWSTAYAERPQLTSSACHNHGS